MNGKTDQFEWRIKTLIGAHDRPASKKRKLGQTAAQPRCAPARAVNRLDPAVVCAAIETMRPAPIIGAILLVWFFCLLFPAASRADSPTEQVRATVDKVLVIVRAANPKSAAQADDQRGQLIKVIYPRFDFLEMAKRSLGPHWARQTPEDQLEFVRVFAALMGRAYAANIESYTSQNVLYTRESLEQNYAQVDTKIVGDRQATVSINYKLHSVGNEWRIYDLVIEDISVVNNYRSQFHRVIANSSYEELVRRLKSKQQEPGRR
jgi:phospholipid transport system substrate-binding protein